MINDLQFSKSATNRTEPIYREAPLIIINKEDILSIHRKSLSGYEKKLNKLQLLNLSLESLYRSYRISVSDCVYRSI